MQDVSTDLEMKSPRVNLVIDRDKAAARRAQRHGDRERAVRRLRPEVVVHDLRPDGSVPGAARARPEVSGAGRLAARRSPSRRPRARSCRSSQSSRFKETVGPQIDQPLRPAAVGHDLVRPEAGDLARHGDRSTSSRSPNALLPATVTTSFEGSAKVFQQSMTQPEPAAVRRDRGGLHRARRAVRELHPSADDSFRPAVGRTSARCSR